MENNNQEVAEASGLPGKYLVFTNTNILENPDLKGPPQQLTGRFHVELQEALIEAIQILESRVESLKSE